jgi:hypothetical protein
MSYPRTLFVLKYRDSDYGQPYCYSSSWGDSDTKKPLSSGLFNSARMVVEMLEAQGVPVKLVHVQDNSTIHRELVNFKADVVIIEAFWVVPEKFDELFSVCPDVKFVIRNHSETPFLANEGIAFDWILKYVTKPNVIMSANAPRMYEETLHLVQHAHPEWTPEQVRAKVAYLPNYYPTENATSTPGPDNCFDTDYLNIGCFGAIRPLKNHMLQAIASLKLAARLGKKLRFHINGGRIEMQGDQILKNLRNLFKHYPQHELVEHPWMPHEAFRALIRTMDVVTQVSFSETFNIVAADAVSQGVPTVTSPEVPWGSRLFEADPTDSSDIASTMARALCVKRRFPKVNLSL